MAVLFLLTMLPAPTGVLAEEKEVSAQELNERGKELARAGKLDEAVVVWKQAFFMATGEAELRIAKNLGIAYYKLGKFEPAFYFLSFFSLRCSDAARVKKADKALQTITKKLTPGRGRFGVNVVPQGAIVYVDERTDDNRYKAPVVWYFKPGHHRFIVMSEDGDEQVTNFMVKEGDLQVFEVTLKADSAIGEAGSGDSGQGESLPITLPVGIGEKSSSGSPWPWITLGLGTAMVGTGGLFEYLALDARDDIVGETEDKIAGGMSEKDANAWKDGQFDDRVKPKNTAAIVLFAAGGATVVGGIVWLIVDGKKSNESPAVSLVPLVSPSGGGFSFGMSF